jgi:hypothetical protein
VDKWFYLRNEDASQVGQGHKILCLHSAPPNPRYFAKGTPSFLARCGASLKPPARHLMRAPAHTHTAKMHAPSYVVALARKFARVRARRGAPGSGRRRRSQNSLNLDPSLTEGGRASCSLASIPRHLSIRAWTSTQANGFRMQGLTKRFTARPIGWKDALRDLSSALRDLSDIVSWRISLRELSSALRDLSDIVSWRISLRDLSSALRDLSHLSWRISPRDLSDIVSWRISLRDLSSALRDLSDIVSLRISLRDLSSALR